MKIIYNNLKCKHCGEDLGICEGDILQIIQECCDYIVDACEKCGEDNYITIEKVDFKIKLV